jgi:serpin B
VQVAVPKFRVESGFPLANALSSIGMPTAFTGAADFSGIDDRRDLQISEVVHKAYVEISEEGTEAAAATGVGIALVSMVSQPLPVFQADRPFLFFIRDTRSGLILFQGRVMDPRR